MKDWANTWLQLYTQKSHITLEFLIEQLSIQLSTNEGLAKQLNPTNTAKVAFASLGNQTTLNPSPGKSQDSQTPATSNTNKKKKEKKPRTCVCGQTHLYRQCPYIIETTRPAGWTPDPAVQKTITEKVQSDAKILRGINNTRRTNQKPEIDSSFFAGQAMANFNTISAVLSVSSVHLLPSEPDPFLK